MLEKIVKMTQSLEQSDFENSSIDAAVFIIADKGVIHVVGGGDIVLLGKGLASAIKRGGPLLRSIVAAEFIEN